MKDKFNNRYRIRISKTNIRKVIYLVKPYIYIERFFLIRNIIVLNRAFLKLHYMLEHPKALNTHQNFDSENFKDSTMGNQQETNKIN